MENHQPIDYYCVEVSAVPYQIAVKAFSSQVPRFIARWVAIKLRVRHAIGWYVPPTYGLAGAEYSKIIDEAAIPAAAIAQWAPLREQLFDLKFHNVQYRQPLTIGQRQQCNALLIHESGQTLALLEWFTMLGAQGMERSVSLELNSYATEDPEVATVATEPQHLAWSDAVKLPFLDAHYHSVQSSLRRMWTQHQHRIAQRTIPRIAHADAVDFYMKKSQRRVNQMKSSGLLRKLTNREVNRLKNA